MSGKAGSQLFVIAQRKEKSKEIEKYSLQNKINKLSADLKKIQMGGLKLMGARSEMQKRMYFKTLKCA